MSAKDSENEWLYSNGLPFTAGERSDGQDVHAYNLDSMNDRVNNGKASLIIVDGTGLGEGKTTLSVHVMDYLQKKPIEFEAQLVLGGEQFMKGISVCFREGYVVIGYDESGDYQKRGALTRLNKMLNRVFDVFRAFKIVVVLILPTFLVLDDNLFEKNIPRMLLHCYGRTKGQGNFSAYSLDRMMWIRHYAKKAVIKADAFKMVQPNYRGHFKNLPPERAAALDRYSTKGKLDVVDIAAIKGEGLMTFKEMAGKLGRTHEWARRKCSMLGLVASKVWKGKKYFSEDDFNRLKRLSK